MIKKTRPLKKLWRRAYATLMAMAVVAIAAGCVTTQWVPVTQARPTGGEVRLRVQPPPDSASKGPRFVTLYHARMEDDSVLVGTPVSADTAMMLKERIPAASAFVGTERPMAALASIGIVVLSVLGVVFLICAVRSANKPGAYNIC